MRTFMPLRYRYNFVAAISTSLRIAETAALTTSGEHTRIQAGNTIWCSSAAARLPVINFHLSQRAMPAA
jgi:hypothetical protein